MNVSEQLNALGKHPLSSWMCSHMDIYHFLSIAVNGKSWVILIWPLALQPVVRYLMNC